MVCGLSSGTSLGVDAISPSLISRAHGLFNSNNAKLATRGGHVAFTSHWKPTDYSSLHTAYLTPPPANNDYATGIDDVVLELLGVE